MFAMIFLLHGKVVFKVQRKAYLSVQFSTCITMSAPYLSCTVLRTHHLNSRKLGTCEVAFINVKPSADVDA